MYTVQNTTQSTHHVERCVYVHLCVQCFVLHLLCIFDARTTFALAQCIYDAKVLVHCAKKMHKMQSRCIKCIIQSKNALCKGDAQHYLLFLNLHMPFVCTFACLHLAFYFALHNVLHLRCIIVDAKKMQSIVHVQRKCTTFG